MAALYVVLVPALSDNYVYLLHDADSGATAVVDPGEAAPVEAGRGGVARAVAASGHGASSMGKGGAEQSGGKAALCLASD